MNEFLVNIFYLGGFSARILIIAIILLIVTIIVFILDYLKNKKIRVVYVFLFIILTFISYLIIPAYYALSATQKVANYNESQILYQKAISLAPLKLYKGVLYVMKGYASTYSNKHVDAVISYEKAFSYLDTYKIKHYGNYIAISYFKTGTLEKAQKIASANSDYTTLSEIYTKSGQTDKLLEIKTKEILETKTLNSVTERAAIFKALGRDIDAEKDLAKVYNSCTTEECKLKYKKYYNELYKSILPLIKAKNKGALHKTVKIIESS